MMSSNSDLTLNKLPWATKKSSLVLRIECLLVLLITIYAFHQLGGSWWLFGAVFVGVDLFLLGYLANAHVGGIVYNLGHSYILPRLILLGSLLAGLDGLVLFALAWNAHISFDRSLGYGLKHESFHLTHLGPIGKPRTK
jgi:hypothetical protein